MNELKPDRDIHELLETNIDQCFRLIVERYSTRLYWHIRRLVILHEDADDALQNTFINAWRNITNFRKESSLYTWLYAIATNEALTLINKRAEKFFWPVYNESQDMKNKIQLERQELNRDFNQNELNMNDREMTEAGDRFIGLEVREAELALEFHNKIKTILAPVKVLRLYQAENQYRLQLLKELQERREGRKNQNIRYQKF